MTELPTPELSTKKAQVSKEKSLNHKLESKTKPPNSRANLMKSNTIRRTKPK
jgi:hypothetical protein